MKYELWYSELERSGVLLRERDTSSAQLKWPDTRVIWTVDTEEYSVAADVCAAVLRWGNRESGGPQATVRLTMAFYLDRQGNQCNAAVPGWVGRNLALLPGSEDVYLGLIDYLSLVAPERGKILGYAYIERPGCVAFDGPALVIQAKRPEALTVVTLLSTDGTEELAQEFYGRFQDRPEISRMVGERLGPEMSAWTIAETQFFGSIRSQSHVGAISESTIPKYAGCKTFVTDDGLAGIVVQTEGKLAGCVWDFFISPRSSARSAYDLLLLAIGQGCDRLVAYEHPLLMKFFERFDFQAVARTPPHFVHMILLTRVFQARESEFRAAIARMSLRTDLVLEQPKCAACDFALHEPPLAAPLFYGYVCARCGFVHVYGTLTPPPPEPPLGPVRLASTR